MRTISGNISDRISPYIQSPSGYHCGHQFGHLKNIKDITLPHSVLSEKSYKSAVLSQNTYRCDHFQAIYQTK